MKKKWGENKIKCKCATCSKTFYQYVYSNSHNSGKYCSRECYYKTLKNRGLSNEWREKISQANLLTKSATVLEPKIRFWRKVQKTKDCWNWLGALHAGYGVFYLGRHKNQIRAPRYSYEINIGEIPEGLTIDHLCRNRACVRPDHLEAVTIQENLSRKPIQKQRL